MFGSGKRKAVNIEIPDPSPGFSIDQWWNIRQACVEAADRRNELVSELYGVRHVVAAETLASDATEFSAMADKIAKRMDALMGWPPKEKANG